MEEQQPKKRGNLIKRVWDRLGIGVKIILPFLVLTVLVASIGVFIITNLVTSSLQERFNNQLLDAGRVVAETMVELESDRLQTLRAIAGTVGVPENLAADDTNALSEVVPQLIINSNSHAVKMLNSDGLEVFGWRKIPGAPPGEGQTTIGTDLSALDEIQKVLNGTADAFGDRRVILLETPEGYFIYTVGPVYQGSDVVGAVMVGMDVGEMVVDLGISAVARVTIYDRNGRVLETTLGRGQELTTDVVDSEGNVQSVSVLQESPERYRIVTDNAETETVFDSVEIVGQEYRLAFGDWRLRGQSFGMFSVALPSNFIPTAAATSRNLFITLFTVAIAAVLTIGFLTAGNIIAPVGRLVDTAVAVRAGDLEQRSNLDRGDEIGKLATAFDSMTDTLAQNNRELMEQASKLGAILESIADGVIVLDNDDQLISQNAAANRLLADMSHDFLSGPLRELANPAVEEHDTAGANNGSGLTSLPTQSQRFQVGNRVLTMRAAPVNDPDGDKLGTVIILRDITSETEAETLKDAFITSISHELRTPLTVIKVYTDLIMKTANGHLDERQFGFIEKISKNSEHLEQHINQLINISEIQAGTFNLDKNKIDFAALVSKVVENWRERLESKNLALALELPEDSVWIHADADRLNWATEVLLSNARNYTLEGGHVEVHLFVDQGEARLDVKDDGIGIATADQPRLFERFFRATNAQNYNVRGVGLGLFITRSIVEMHNGRIWLESESGKGSTFSIALPLMETRDELARAERQ